MPTERGTVRVAEAVDQAVELGTTFVAVVDQVAADGIVTRDEHQMVRSLARAFLEVLEGLPGMVSAVDAAMVSIGAIAGAGMVTDWAYRRVHEAHRDTKELVACERPR